MARENTGFKENTGSTTIRYYICMAKDCSQIGCQHHWEHEKKDNCFDSEKGGCNGCPPCIVISYDYRPGSGDL